MLGSGFWLIINSFLLSLFPRFLVPPCSTAPILLISQRIREVFAAAEGEFVDAAEETPGFQAF